MTNENERIPMTKKARRKSSTIAYSSSDAMAYSKPPNEVLALGARIVRELNLEPSVDTLGRWMAHHLADVMLEAEKASADEREAAQAKAVELILKLWSRRHDLPGSAHPLKQLENVISVLRRFQYDSWPFHRRNRDELNELLADAFDGLRILVAHGVLLAAGTIKDVEKIEETAGLLDDEEQRVLNAVRGWIEFINSGRRSDVPVVILTEQNAEEHAAEKAKFVELEGLEPDERSRSVFLDRIDKLITTLQALKTIVSQGLSKVGNEPSSDSADNR